MILLSVEQNKNLKLQGEIKELELRLRGKDELVNTLYVKLERKDLEIKNLKKKIEELKLTGKQQSTEISVCEDTLKLFNIGGQYNI